MKFDLRAVAHALGGQVAGKDTALAPGPGHTSRDRSLAVRLDPAAPDGFLIFSHAGDDWKLCRDHVRARLGLPTWESGDGYHRAIPHDRVEKWDLAVVETKFDSHAMSDDELLRISAARRTWEAGHDPRGTPAEKYLRDERKLDLPDELAGTVLRFNPRCPWRNENTGKTDHVPALIVPFRSIDQDSITGIHRIALRDDGTKLGRRMLGIVHRAAIKFDLVDNDSLAIGEGVETTMAARQLGFAPAWALGSVGAISFFPLIEGVKVLFILGEKGDASARAVRLCGTRWQRAGRRVRIVMPDIGSDLNDVLAMRSFR
jgi:putative DNA primase/helicase